MAACRTQDPAIAEAQHLSPGIASLVNELESGMVLVPEGRFLMGSASGVGEDEHPVHPVTVNAFLLSRFEVTASQFAVFERETGRPATQNPLQANHPAINISWDDAMAFIRWLNQSSRLRFRLPSESEWEYAARAGATTEYWWGNDFVPGRINGTGLRGDDTWTETAPVDSLAPNGRGLYHVLGNVWEWTADCYYADYAGSPGDGSARPGEDACGRVLRGGSWSDTPAWLRVSTRNWFDRTERFDYVGVRLAADPGSASTGDRR